MIDPIVFNQFDAVIVPPGDATEESPLWRGPNVSILSSCLIGTFNGENVYIAHGSESHWVIYCPNRAISIFVRKAVNTYGVLRRHFQVAIEYWQEEKERLYELIREHDFREHFSSHRGTEITLDI